ncbi:DNA-binding domain-containing protein [Motilimonas sp. E26]|uniref:HvfC/BufC N-terminal domain-containing protein n=1 Tax=Motilimonas sp. E26 TaxID=2865674 RepID=UPI001E4E7DD7|nr:DNA-binding domain-containing protein [Motilimonas sp. E26]MCE0557896.1 DNA-binding domain-containing protein [Motilimonas sp. E26]
MSRAYNLVERQQWLMQRILGGVQQNQYLEENMAATGPLAIEHQLAIYQQGFRLRLIECMKAEFPSLVLFLGEEVFHLFVVGFLSVNPSKHYSLYELGDGFAEFLASTRPQPQQVPKEVAEKLKIPEQLALLERARAVSLRAEGCEHRNKVTVDSFMIWPLLSLPETSILVDTDFSLFDYMRKSDSYLAKRDKGEEAIAPQPPSLQKEHILVYRNHFRVAFMRVEKWQSDVINALSYSEPCDVNWPAVAQRAELTESQLLSKLTLWLPKAAAASQIILNIAEA